jgi:cytochrome oxidase assembly protein ShyY1
MRGLRPAFWLDRKIRRSSSSVYKTRSTSDVLALVVFGGMSVMLCGLGSWQIYRRSLKLDAIAERENKLMAEPVDVLELFRVDQGDLNFRRVFCKGELHYDREMMVGPRSAPKGTPKRLLGEAAGVNTGVLIVTPMTLTDGSSILVNRGWVATAHNHTVHKEDPSPAPLNPPSANVPVASSSSSLLSSTPASNSTDITKTTSVSQVNLTAGEIKVDQASDSASPPQALDPQATPQIVELVCVVRPGEKRSIYADEGVEYSSVS